MRVIFVGLQEYITIEKTLGSINHKNMELLQRWKEIMKVQSELIKEKKLLDCKVDSNILQKLCLEKRKLILLPIVEVPIQSTSQPSSPQNSWQNLPALSKGLRGLFQLILQRQHQLLQSNYLRVKLQSHYCGVKFLIVICCRHLENLMKLNKI